ncbi:phage holin family protein [Paracoccus sp. JM45]|uniref:phage holin family protein n=1 Tax=Paracoccus sp. JM45 TaxID=2283626 RepID=UPI000E6BF40E|nr:phage holin family protein [Paracoccus sp. JM45]RJE79820.1 phage holin family protein [Paracoccus sp. JM45]
MFDFARNAKLAIGDTARRAALKGAAGFVAVFGGGFLIAALWSFLANNLEWGSTLASLAIGGGFVAIAIILIIMSSRTKHKMPTSDELKKEVEARVSLATDAAILRARSEADKMVAVAETKAHALMDEAGFRAAKLAGDAERRVFGSVRQTASSLGMTAQNIQSVQRSTDRVVQQARQNANSNAGSMAKLVGAFAIGITLAAKLKEGRRDHDNYDPDDFL